jgi:16S rRNA (cytosine967-C5)-methyltransferase
MSSVSPARAAAFDVLARVERESSYATELLNSTAFTDLSAADHSLAMQLVMGVLRWRSRLDDIISAASSHPQRKLDLEILIALRLAVYQLGWLDRIPKHAALNESVELVKRARKRSAATFVNAVLRKITQQPRMTVNLEDKFDSASDLARASAHPLWLIERWAENYGLAAAQCICKYDQAIPPTAIRLRHPDAEKRLHEEGICFGPGRLLSSAREIQSGEIAKTQAFRDGVVVIQDEGSQLVAALAAHATGTLDNVLDCCAAPGGKTLAIADQQPASDVTAIDIHPHRARLMQHLVMQATREARARIQIVAADARRLPFSTRFHRVLADVPCSGTGTLARNPEIKWNLAPQDLDELHRLQVHILRAALAHVREKGRLIYSTCSLEQEENEHVIREVLAEEKTFRIVGCATELEQLRDKEKVKMTDVDSLTRGPYLRTIPGVHPCDGFFAAIFEKL